MQSTLLEIAEIERLFSKAETQDDYNLITEKICCKKKLGDECYPDTLLLCALLVEYVCINKHFDRNLGDIDALLSKGFEYIPIDEAVELTQTSGYNIESLLDKDFAFNESESLARRYFETKKDLKFSFVLALTSIHMNLSQYSTDAFLEKLKLGSSPTFQKMNTHNKYRETSTPFTFATSAKTDAAYAKTNTASAKTNTPSFISNIDIDKIVNPVNIKKFLDKKVVSQNDAKIGLSVALSSHLISYYNNETCQPNVSLLIGPTGSGKTMIAKEIVKYTDLPVVFIEASQITREGWKGLDKSLVLRELKSKAKTLRDAEYGIVVIDEFDKACFMGHSSNNENVGESNQSNYLSLFDGSEIRDEHGNVYKTSNLMFILTGAFSHMEEYLKEENKIGFNQTPIVERAPDEIRSTLVKMGLLPETVGRITHILKVSPISEEEAFNAIFSPESDLVQYLNSFRKQTNKNIEINRVYAKERIKTALENKLGIRGCINILKEDFTKALFEAYEEDTEIVYMGKEYKKEAAN